MTSLNRIVYEALDVCNGVEMAAVEEAVARAGVRPGMRAVDVGTGNAAVAIRLAERFGLEATAIERDPAMAALARARIAAAGSSARLLEGSAAQALGEMEPPDLITALGTTDVNGEGRPTPEAALGFLAGRLTPGGALLWGDLVWIAEPPGPLRQAVEAVNLYTDDAGWKAAAGAAGLAVEWSAVSPQAVFDAYAAAVDRAARRWLTANADAPEAEAVRADADRVEAIFEFGRPYIGFGLYLLRRPR